MMNRQVQKIVELKTYENLFNDDGKLICSHFTEFENCPTKDKWHLHATALLFKGEIDSFNLHKDNKNEIVDGELKINKVMGVSPNFFITKEMMNVRNWLEENYKDTIKQIGEDANYMDLLIQIFILSFKVNSCYRYF